MAVESVSGCSWNECPDGHGIASRLSSQAWNGQDVLLDDFLQRDATNSYKPWFFQPECALINVTGELENTAVIVKLPTRHFLYRGDLVGT